jgi:putative tryptophan/tyrosine transport system ATP-binding protein
VIKLEALSLAFNRGSALENRLFDGLSLDIGRGEFVTLIGSNGAGKSTLLNVIAGELAIDRGSVLIGSANVTGMPAWRRAEFVARVFQDPRAGSCEALSLEENLALAASRGERRTLVPALDTERRRRFAAQLAQLGLGLEKRLRDPMGLLSGGQRQAASLVMATLRPMQILLLDEHVAALDPRTAALVLELTARLIADHRLTALMVTHSMRHALAVGSRTIMLHQGSVVLDVAGEERKRMTVNELVARFRRQHGEEIDSDSLLLA